MNFNMRGIGSWTSRFFIYVYVKNITRYVLWNVMLWKFGNPFAGAVITYLRSFAIELAVNDAMSFLHLDSQPFEALNSSFIFFPNSRAFCWMIGPLKETGWDSSRHWWIQSTRTASTSACWQLSIFFSYSYHLPLRIWCFLDHVIFFVHCSLGHQQKMQTTLSSPQHFSHQIFLKSSTSPKLSNFYVFRHSFFWNSSTKSNERVRWKFVMHWTYSTYNTVYEAVQLCLFLSIPAGTEKKNKYQRSFLFLSARWSILYGYSRTIYRRFCIWLYKRKNLYQVALLSTFYKGDHGGLIIQ